MSANQIGLAALITVVAGATPSRSIAEEHNDPFEAMQNPKRLLLGAMLTEAQVAQIRELRKAQWAREREIEKRFKVLSEEFDDKFTSAGSIDAAALASLVEQMEELQTESENAKFKIMLQMRALLTAEQLDRVSQTHQKMKSLESQMRALEPTVASEAVR
jgi:Spy/CpxP family protein refolding chaperone